MIDYDQYRRLSEQDVIEVIPLAYMPGRTLNEAFIILDEVQNTTISQMKMFLTRMGTAPNRRRRRRDADRSPHEPAERLGRRDVAFAEHQRLCSCRTDGGDCFAIGSCKTLCGLTTTRHRRNGIKDGGINR